MATQWLLGYPTKIVRDLDALALASMDTTGVGESGASSVPTLAANNGTVHLLWRRFRLTGKKWSDCMPLVG